MDWWNNMLKKVVRERESHIGGDHLCLLSAATGFLDNTLMMAIGYYEHHSNCGDVSLPKKSRPACKTRSNQLLLLRRHVDLGRENAGGLGLQTNSKWVFLFSASLYIDYSEPWKVVSPPADNQKFFQSALRFARRYKNFGCGSVQLSPRDSCASTKLVHSALD